MYTFYLDNLLMNNIFFHYFSYKADIKQKELNSLKYPKTFQYFI